MSGKVVGAMLAAVVSVAGYSDAYALNYCFKGELGQPIVANNFRIPGRGTCRSLNGFVPTPNDPELISGTACTSADGAKLNLTFTRSPAATVSSDVSETGDISVALPSLENGTLRVRLRPIGSSTGGDHVISTPISGKICSREDLVAK